MLTQALENQWCASSQGQAKSFTLCLLPPLEKHMLILKGNILKKTNVREDSDFKGGQKKKKINHWMAFHGVLEVVKHPLADAFPCCAHSWFTALKRVWCCCSWLLATETQINSVYWRGNCFLIFLSACVARSILL